MKKLHPFIVLAIVLTFATSSIYGQDSSYQEDDPSYSSAYMQGRETAHWSVYIPIAILVGAAIWFGISNQNHEKNDSNNSQDGLGSIASSKRRSSSSSSGSSNNSSKSYHDSSKSYSSKNHRRSYSPSSGSYSHH